MGKALVIKTDFGDNILSPDKVTYDYTQEKGYETDLSPNMIWWIDYPDFYPLFYKAAIMEICKFTSGEVSVYSTDSLTKTSSKTLFGTFKIKTGESSIKIKLSHSFFNNKFLGLSFSDYSARYITNILGKNCKLTNLNFTANSSMHFIKLYDYLDY